MDIEGQVYQIAHLMMNAMLELCTCDVSHPRQLRIAEFQQEKPSLSACEAWPEYLEASTIVAVAIYSNLILL